MSMPRNHERQKGKWRKPSISLRPLTPEDALAGLMQVQPPGKEAVPDEKAQGEAEPEAKEST
jgi:hypothetical protein